MGHVRAILGYVGSILVQDSYNQAVTVLTTQIQPRQPFVKGLISVLKPQSWPGYNYPRPPSKRSSRSYARGPSTQI